MNLPDPLRPTPPRSRPVPLRTAGAALALVALLGSGCGGGAGPTEGGEVARYEVRGVVLALPRAEDPLSALEIRHEAIDDFVGIEGLTVGMDSMRMPFPVADGVDLDGIEVGDQVAFSLEVEWQGDPPYRVAAIRELPPGTELEFRDAEQPGG